MRSTLHNFCQLGLAPARGSDPKKGKVRSSLHNFCHLRLAPARGSDPKKRKVRSTISTISVSSAMHLPEVQTRKKRRAIHSPQFLSSPPGTCPRFRPEIKEVRPTLHNFCQLGQAPARGSDSKKKRQMRSTLHKFCRLGQAPARGSDARAGAGARATATIRKKEERHP